MTASEFELVYCLSPSGTPMTKHAVEGQRLVLGTEGGCDVVLEADDLVSPRHAVIHLSGDAPTLVDLESRHGTRLNGERVSSVRLRSMDQLAIGRSRLIFCHRAKDLSTDEIARQLKAAEFLVEPDQVYPAAPDEAGATPMTPEAMLAHVLQQIGGETDLDALLRKVLAALFDVLPAERGFILVHDAERNRLVPRAARSRTGRTNELLAYSGTLLARARATREAFLIRDALVHPELGGAPSVQMHQLRGAMCVPLFRGSTFLGALQLDTATAGNVFDRGHVSLATCVGHLLALVIEHRLLLDRAQREADLRDRLSGLLGRRLLEVLVEDRMDLQGGETIPLAVLHADVRGFSRMCLDIPSEAVYAVMNEIFDEVCEVIFEYEGLVMQFAGDEVKALFGGPWGTCREGEAAVQAVRAGLEIVQVLEQRRARAEAAVPALEMGVGMGYGSVTVGRVGALKRGDISYQGHAANQAARMCSHARPGQVLLTDDAAAAITADLSEDRATLPDGLVLTRRDSFEAKNMGLLGVWEAARA